MTIVAFLQNMWLKSPGSYERAYQRFLAQDRKRAAEFRERMIAYALFRGCLTGRRLKQALGEELCERIVWEEASPVVTNNPQECPPADPDHIATVLARHEPAILISFTAAGVETIDRVRLYSENVPWLIRSVHPACRAGDTLERLRLVRETVGWLERGKGEELTVGEQLRRGLRKAVL